MQLQVNQPDLSQMFGADNLYNTLYGMQRQDQATANQNQNLGAAQQEQQFQAQDQPYNLQQLAANVGHTQAMTGLASAQIPGVAADSTIKTNAADADSAVPTSVRRKKALDDYLSKTSAAELEQHANKAQSDLYSDDPQVAAHARLVLTSMPAIQARMMEIKAQGANEANVANINQSGANQRDVNDINAGKYNKNTTAYLMMKGFSGNYQQQAGAWEMKAAADEDSGDHDSAMKARQMAALARASDVDSKAAATYTALSKSPDFASLGLKPAVNPAAVAPKAPAMADAMNSGSNAQPLPQANTTVKAAPKAGDVTVHGGVKYQFLGGDPSNKANWRQM